MITTYQPNYSEMNNNNALQNVTGLMHTMFVANSANDPAAVIVASLFNLRYRMQIYAINMKPTPLSNAILNVALSALNFYQMEQDIDRLFDLYITINSVFNIVCNATSEQNLQNEITAFLSLREEVLRGDRHDYCNSTSVANEFCYHLVKVVFPEIKSPTNKLLHNAITQDKGKPSLWQHPIEMDGDLPASCGDFFRTADGHIQLYESILRRAIAQLKRGHAHPAHVWLNTDPRFPANTPLKKADLTILKYRSPTFNTLFTYSEKLAEQSSGLYDRFVMLKEGLAKSVTASGSEAKPIAYFAIQAFSDWWNDLNKTEEGQKLRTNMEGINKGELGRFINGFLPKGDYCAPGTGNNLENILCRPGVAEAFRLIEVENDAKMESLSSGKNRVSHKQLDQWEAAIKNELKNIPPNMPAGKNVFTKANQYIAIFNQLSSLNLDHFKLLADGKKIEFLKIVLAQNHPGLYDALGNLLIAYIQSDHDNLARLILSQRPDVSQEVCDADGNHAIHITHMKGNLEIMKLLCQNPIALQVTNQQNENIFQLVTKLAHKNTPLERVIELLFLAKTYPAGFQPSQMRVINKYFQHKEINVVLPYGEVPETSRKEYYKQYKQSMFYKHNAYIEQQPPTRDTLKSKLHNVFHRRNGAGR